jgi:hypothetical protein
LLAPGEIEDVAGLCPEEDMERRWLADYRVLSVATSGDSGVATAAITTAVRQIEGPRDSTIATVSIADDTAHWRMIRSSETRDRWMVCGDAVEGFGVFPSTWSVRWEAGSAEAARAAIDSIRRARGLPLVR